MNYWTEKTIKIVFEFNEEEIRWLKSLLQNVPDLANESVEHAKMREELWGILSDIELA